MNTDQPTSAGRGGSHPAGYRVLSRRGFDGWGREAAIGLTAVVSATAAKAVLNAMGGQDVSYIPLFVAVAVAAMTGGFRAALLAILVGAAIDALVFQSAGGSLFSARPAALVRFVLFVPASAFVAWLVAAGRVEREQARTAAARFRQLLDDSPDFIVLVDSESWTVEYANAACAAFGWPVARLIGRSSDLVIPDLRDLRLDAETDAADVLGEVGVQTTGRAMTVLSETGEARPVEVLARRIVADRTGRPLLFVSARDMTERIDSATRLMRLARVERARAAELRAVIDSIDDAVAVFGPGGEVVLANEGMSRLAGGPIGSEAELMARLGVSGQRTNPADVPGHISEVHLTGPDRWLEMRRFAVRTDEADPSMDASSLVVLRDTTVDRVARETRETFLGILSHELRTPVTTILGIAHILNRTASVATDEERRELAGDVLIEAERLHRLVEDLLVLSRTEGGRLEYEPEPLLIQHSIPPVLAAEGRRAPEVTFTTNVPPSLPPVAGDRTYVDQVLRNLIGNAAKYGPDQGAEVIVQASEEDGEIVVRVLDRGPGFDPEDAERLFDIFFRASRTAHLKAGAGIGLFVTRSLVEMMDGHVWARPRDGGGSEFGFALPVLAMDAELEESASATTR